MLHDCTRIALQHVSRPLTDNELDEMSDEEDHSSEKVAVEYDSPDEIVEEFGELNFGEAYGPWEECMNKAASNNATDIHQGPDPRCVTELNSRYFSLCCVR